MKEVDLMIHTTASTISRPTTSTTTSTTTTSTSITITRATTLLVAPALKVLKFTVSVSVILTILLVLI